MEKLELFYPAGKNAQHDNCYGKIVWQLLKKLNTELSYEPATGLVGPRELKTHIYPKTHTDVSEALFTVANMWKQPKCSSTDEYTNEM